jgi:type VI secretion system protein ImpF
MAKIRPDQPLVPSVLDRLIDERPDESRETPKSRNQVMREVKLSLQRDLENLLNTRRRATGWPADLIELELSLANYGIPDIAGADLGSAENREQFARTVVETIRRFEPRFQQVNVSMLQNADPMERTLRFRIDALLRAEPAPEPVVFDSSMQPATCNVQVRGAGPRA